MCEIRAQDSGCRMVAAAAIRSLAILLAACAALPAYDLADVILGIERRYSTVETVRGNFQQTYRAPGIRREETGEFWMKRPGLMRWEYRSPEEQLFVADGRESFLYVPRDRQVTVQPFSTADLHATPLRFLFGSGDINGSFLVSWEKEFKPKAPRTLMVRLIPRRQEAEYAFLVLEIDEKTYDLRRIAIREPGGSTSEIMLTNVVINTKMARNLFRFKTPKGVEEIRLNSER